MCTGEISQTGCAEWVWETATGWKATWREHHRPWGASPSVGEQDLVLGMTQDSCDCQS
jgi:hypothetical protein